VNASGQATINIPWNNAANGNKGYVVYGLPRPQGSLSLSDVSQVLSDPAPTPATNGTARLTAINVITTNSFNVALNTASVTLSDGYRDKSADGSDAFLRFDGGLDLNANGTVDFRTSGDMASRTSSQRIIPATPTRMAPGSTCRRSMRRN
jgi:hypothetical protein